MIKTDEEDMDQGLNEGASVSELNADVQQQQLQQQQQEQQQPQSNSSIQDERVLHIFIDLQKHWLSELQCSREKILVEMTEKLHQEFLSDQQKIRTELLTEFKQELDDVRSSLEERYREMINADVAQMEATHRRELSGIKKKQWCWHCENEAVYFCCWNTSYCSQQCQHDHWRTHRKYCRRRKGGKEDPAIDQGKKGNSNGTNGDAPVSG
uniref:MYND-type domain-containing protein n=1 Tax=Panagrolaimus sp. PS1159 TaxID=55785 RepID=A0AC35GMI2_9BILA